jgi:hypothetical protein
MAILSVRPEPDRTGLEGWRLGAAASDCLIGLFLGFELAKEFYRRNTKGKGAM